MRIRAAVVVGLFLLTTLPSALAATETQLSQLTIGDFAPPYRLRTSVASNGRGYVVAWEAAAFPEAEVTTCYLRVLGADGVPLQPFPTVLGPGREPRVVWNGHEYLAVWGITSPTTGSLPTPSVVGMRVREDGTLIDTKPVTLVSEVNPFSYYTTVEWNGSQYLVTWNRGIAIVDADLQHFTIIPSNGGTPFYSATLGGSFVVLSSFHESSDFSLSIQTISKTGVVGTAKSLNATRGNIVPFQDGYALIWDDDVNFHSGVLNADGRMLSSLIIGQGRLGFPRMATRDGRLVASWEAIPDDRHTRVCTMRLDTMFQPVCSAVSEGRQHDPSIGMAATSILVAWSERTVTGDTVRVLPTPLSDVPHVEAGLGRSVSDASLRPVAERRADGSGAIGWSEFNASTQHFEIHLGKTIQGVMLAERAVFPDAFDQSSPAIAGGTGRTMALWEEGPGDSLKIRMTIIDDASKAVIATLPLASGSAPSVAFDGKEWLATWQSSGS
ncbi:MAG: hypothetical protein QOE82_2536, partial [Thermoanaerobaculia bacterium]|nr:hypothetical protein [Thermoanaerobaculia bacterium]